MLARQTSCMYVWTHGQRKKERPKGDKKKRKEPMEGNTLLGLGIVGCT
jgi:hypothetical protein